MATLYELREQYQKVLEMMEEGQLDPETLKDTLESIQDTVDAKFESMVRIKLTLDSDIEAVKAEEKRLAERRKQLEKQREQLIEYMKYQMQNFGMKEFRTPLAKVKIVKNPPSIEVLDENKVPEEFKVVKTEVKIDKRKLLELAKSLEGNPEDLGFRVVNDKTTLKIS